MTVDTPKHDSRYAETRRWNRVIVHKNTIFRSFYARIMYLYSEEENDRFLFRYVQENGVSAERTFL